MSNVWQAQRRLLLELLEAFARRLSGEEKVPPEVVEEQAVRLLAGMLMLLRQHKINKRGQCRFCGWSGKIWHFWRRRPRCTVYRNLNFVMNQSYDGVWWRLFENLGQRTSLDETRKWVAERGRAKRFPDDEHNGGACAMRPGEENPEKFHLHLTGPHLVYDAAMRPDEEHPE